MRQVGWLWFCVLAACGTTPSAKPDGLPVETEAVEEGDVQPEAFEIVTETVEITSGELTLAATLVRPRASGPRPGAVIVGDWGIRGRDGVIAEMFGVRLPTEVAIYRSLAEGLAARGVAVLIYDKRNCVKDSEPWCSYPAEYATKNPAVATAFVEDALAMAAWLAGRAEVGSVSLIGHGHGAEVALVAAQNAKIAGVVLLQPSANSLSERARFQLEESVRLIEARIAEVGDSPEADMLTTRKTELTAALASPNVLGLDSTATADLDVMHVQFLKAAQLATPPRLAVLGDVDPGEPASNADRLLDLFAEQLVVLPHLSRAMVSVADDGDPTVLSPDVLIHVSAFLNADLAK